MWASAMSRFGYDLSNELKGEQVHRLDDVLTLTVDVCDLFNSLSICFVEIVRGPYLTILLPLTIQQGENEYRLESIPGSPSVYTRDYPPITFKSGGLIWTWTFPLQTISLYMLPVPKSHISLAPRNGSKS